MDKKTEEFIKKLFDSGFVQVGGNDTSDAIPWDFEKQPAFVGQFETVVGGIGANNSNLYIFSSKGQRYSIWGSAILDSRFKNLVPGQEVAVIYEGKRKSPKTGRVYKSYQVFKKPVSSNEDSDTGGA